MKKLLGSALSLVALFGALSLFAPMPKAAPQCNGKRYKYCTIEPDGPIPTCPPCQYYEPCGPHCGCISIPGCKP